MSRSDDDLDDALEGVYDRVDVLLRAKAFDQVDALLDSIDVAQSRLIVSLAYASITWAARDVLRSRAHFMERLRKHTERVEPTRAKELLAGFD
jgi:hypothetical protein